MGPKVRFFPVNNLPESRQMRLDRMYPGAQYRQIPGTENWQILVPRPKTSAVGGKDLVDDAMVEWTEQFIHAIFEAGVAGS